jgi:hypothetical protein
MPRLRTSKEPKPVPGTPAGLLAFPVWAGEPQDAPWSVHGRHTMRNLRGVVLRAPPAPDTDRHAAALLDIPGHRAFVFGARQRDWASIRRYFGGVAEDVALELARAGIVELRAILRKDLVLVGKITGWKLTDRYLPAPRPASAR